MSKPIKHHYVSKFYLKNFTKSGGSKEKLFAYDKSKNHYFQSNPKDICFIKNFNTISYPGKEYILEHELAKIESDISTSFNNVIGKFAYPNEEQLDHILTFMTLTALRNPKMRTLFDDFYRQIIDRMMMLTYATEERYLDQCKQAGIKEEDILPYEKQKAFVMDKSRYTIDINHEVHIENELKTVEMLIELLHNRKWHLIVSNDLHGKFITSDYPVSLTSQIDRGPYGVGFGLPQTEVTFPISKSLALIGTFEDLNPQKIIFATPALVNELNLRTFNAANKQVFSTSKIIY